VALVGVWPELAAALLFIGLVGIGDTIVDVAGYTLIQRAAPDEVLSRVFGALDGVFLGTAMLGSLVAPLAIGAVGERGAMIAIGSTLPALAILGAGTLRGLDVAEPPSALELLRAHPIFAPLPPAIQERLADALVPLRVPAGEVVIRQGDPGDRFYVIVAGELDVEVAGAPGGGLGPGEGFGEIALLRDVPRTATVTARTDAELLALDRDDFLGAVTGHAASAEAADAIVSARLGAPRAELGM
jgi:MFS family permease